MDESISLKMKYLVDIALAIDFIILVLTGLAKFPGLTKYLSFVSNIISWRTMAFIHDWSGIVLALLVLMHLILNWRWIVAMTKSMFKGKK